MYVNGQPFFAKGVCYSPIPVGFSPDTKHDWFGTEERAVWMRDINNLRAMGANVIRLYGWDHNKNHNNFLDYCYNNGNNPIYVVPSIWYPKQNINDAKNRNAIKETFRTLVRNHKDHPAILFWITGNELNSAGAYGDSQANLDAFFSLSNELADVGHQEEGPNFHPVTTTLMDNNIIKQIALYDKTTRLDFWAIQLYRGKSFYDFFQQYKLVSGKPAIITEFGVDAYDDIARRENQDVHTEYSVALFSEIMANKDVVSGGIIFEYSDEWWKGRDGITDATHSFCPDRDLWWHGICGFPSSGLPDKYFNEEWFGIYSIAHDNGTPNPNIPVDILTPRSVYFALQKLFKNGGGGSAIDTSATYSITVKGGVWNGRTKLSALADGTAVDLWTTDEGNGRQRWKFVDLGNNIYYMIVAGGMSNDRVFVSAMPDGTKVDMWKGDDNTGRQKWRLESMGGNEYRIWLSSGVNDRSRQMLSCTDDGTKVDLWIDDGSGRQRWILTKLFQRQVGKAHVNETESEYEDVGDVEEIRHEKEYDEKSETDMNDDNIDGWNESMSSHFFV